jgi:hypothetical protein
MLLRASFFDGHRQTLRPRGSWDARDALDHEPHVAIGPTLAGLPLLDRRDVTPQKLGSFLGGP